MINNIHYTVPTKHVHDRFQFHMEWTRFQFLGDKRNISLNIMYIHISNKVDRYLSRAFWSYEIA